MSTTRNPRQSFTESLSLNIKMRTVLETDTSWLSKNQTLEEAARTMQKSISMVIYPANIPYIWVADLESNSIRSQQSDNILEDGAKTPHCRPQRKRRASTKPSDFLRLRNSFLQYRNLAQQCFSDETTQPILSKRIAELWAAETPEMRFFCERNAAIESRIPSSRVVDLTQILGLSKASLPWMSVSRLTLSSVHLDPAIPRPSQTARMTVKILSYNPGVTLPTIATTKRLTIERSLGSPRH